MKRLFRPILISFRRWVLSTFRLPVKWYYRYAWNPKPGSLEENLQRLAESVHELQFIQVGANDGFQNDPLYKFIKAYAWKGLCFEPQPLAYRLLRKLYRKDQVTPIHAAISDKIGQQDLFKLSFTDQRWASGLSSFDRQHLQQQIDTGFVAAKCKKYGIEAPTDENSWISTIPVRTVTFEKVLHEHSLGALDLLHIDTEGFDFEIFKLFPFHKFHPKVILIETAHLSQDDQSKLHHSLSELGYTLTQFGVDLWAQKG